VSLGNSVEEIITLIGDSQRQAEQVNQIDSKSYFIGYQSALYEMLVALGVITPEEKEKVIKETINEIIKKRGK